MYNRAELKEAAKAQFKKNYVKAVIAALIITLITGFAGGRGTRTTYNVVVNGNDVTVERHGSSAHHGTSQSEH